VRAAHPRRDASDRGRLADRIDDEQVDAVFVTGRDQSVALRHAE
jgi:hypothetical protein